MAYFGHLVMEDHTIRFHLNYYDNTVTYTVTDTFLNEEETVTTAMEKFFKALSIAVHPDGFPDANRDYFAAEEALGKIRWIP